MTHHDAQLSPAAVQLAGRFRRPTLSAPLVSLTAAVVDWFLLTVAFWTGLYGGADPSGFAPLAALAASGLAALAGVAALGAWGGYAVKALRRPRAWAPLVLAAPAGLLAAAMGSALPGLNAVVAAAGGMAAAALLLLPVRAALGSALDWAVDSGLTERRAVLVGGGEGARALIQGLAERPGNDVRICAIFDDRGGVRAPDLVLDVPKIGRFDELVAFARRAEIDMIVISLPATAEGLIARLMAKFAVLPVPVHLSSYTEDFAFGRGRAELVMMANGTFSARRRLTKRALDLGLGTAALVLAAPVMALAALAIRLEGPGPILFRQPRSGFNERTIEVLKFRTMRHEAADVAARRVVRRADARITRVGRLLRRTSIDELPQLINVLRGELSLVGPRPHAVGAVSASQEAFDQLVEGYSARHRLPPGITGLAQVNGLRGTIEDPEQLRARVAHDLAYIENWSIWLDLKILARTPLSLLDASNAY